MTTEARQGAADDFSCSHDAPSSARSSLEGIGSVVDALCASANGLARGRGADPRRQSLPSPEVLATVVGKLRSVLFPGYFGVSDLTDENAYFHVGATLDEVVRLLQEQVQRGLCFVCDRATPRCPECEIEAREKTRAFVARLPEVRRLLATDVQAAYEGDPAATGPEEAIFCYPGILAVTAYRLAHVLHELGVPMLPRIITEYAHGETGIDIHPGAEIGGHFFIDHGTGVVIGETAVIGDRVRLYQGVTLGAKSFTLDEAGRPRKGVPRHPIVEDDVIIYGGATILGRVTIGRGAVIGGNVWLTRSVPPGAKVTQAQVREERFDAGAGI
jgi:serine O-acetyltransferase